MEIGKWFWRRVRQVAPQKRQAYFVLALLSVALLIRYLVFLFYFDANIPYGADSDGYIEWGRSLASGGVSLPEYLVGGGYANTILYPLFLAAQYRVFGVSQSPVIVTQVVLSLCIVVMVFLMALETIGKRGGYLVALIAAAYFYEIEWAFYILTETLSIFLVILTFYLFIKYSGTRRRLHLLAAVIALTLSVLARWDNGVFIPAIFLWLAFQVNLPKPLDRPWKVLLLFLMILIAVSPLLVRPLQSITGAFSLGMQWDKWQQQGRRGGFSGMYDKSWRDIITFVVQQPGKYLRFAWEKFVATWLLPLRPGYGKIHALVNIVFFPFAFFAVVFTAISWIKGKVNRRVFSLLLALWLSKTLFIMATFIDWDFRYRLPVDFIALICVAYTLDTALSFARRRLLPASTS